MEGFSRIGTGLFSSHRSANTNKTSSKSAPIIDDSMGVGDENEDQHDPHVRKSMVSFADDFNNVEEEKVEETADAVP